MANPSRLGAASLGFLADLRRHNDREWFLANKSRYEANVRDPFLALIEALAPGIARLDPPFHGDPKPVGGSMMRIHRDVRFSKDKSPYKTAVAAHFALANAQDCGPALYLRIEPGNSAVGGGVWQPDADQLRRIRERIVDDPAAWRRLVTNASFAKTFTLEGESLQRVPKGMDPEHEFATDLKRKDFIIGSRLSDADVASSSIARLVMDRFKVAAPFMHFLAAATVPRR